MMWGLLVSAAMVMATTCMCTISDSCSVDAVGIIMLMGRGSRRWSTISLWFYLWVLCNCSDMNHLRPNLISC